jgi:peptidoglycan-associated lipoprotein
MKAIQWAFLLIAVVVLATGCSKKNVMKNQSETNEAPPAQAETVQPAPAPEVQPDPDDGRAKFLDQVVLFDFDSAVLRPEAQALLEAQAEWLKANPGVPLVLIEGHCDERGTEAYNMALGAKRAESVKRYLIDLGVDNQVLDTQSFGEEKPAAYGHNEEAWSQNRRASFVLN